MIILSTTNLVAERKHIDDTISRTILVGSTLSYYWLLVTIKILILFLFKICFPKVVLLWHAVLLNSKSIVKYKTKCNS